MPSSALQFLFRLALGVTVGIGLTPVALAARSFHRLSCWCLLILGVAGAAVAHLSGGATEHSGLVIVLAVGLSVLACAAAALWQRGRDESARLAIFMAGLLAALAVTLATDWNRVPGGLGIGLGLADLVSSGLLLGVTMAALWLGLWHLNTVTMHRVPLAQLVWIAGVALAVRLLLGVLGLGIGRLESREVTASLGLFLVFRWALALLSWFLLRILAREVGRPLNRQTVAVLAYLALFASLVGELAAQLVSVETPYTG
jgi:hypothetical protein